MSSRFSSSPLGPYARLASWALGGAALGGCEEAQERERNAAMVAVEEQRAGKQ
jgi:hypothetical protein